LHVFIIFVHVYLGFVQKLILMDVINSGYIFSGFLFSTFKRREGGKNWRKKRKDGKVKERPKEEKNV